MKQAPSFDYTARLNFIFANPWKLKAISGAVMVQSQIWEARFGASIQKHQPKFVLIIENGIISDRIDAVESCSWGQWP